MPHLQENVTIAVVQVTLVACADGVISPADRMPEDDPAPAWADTRDLSVGAAGNAEQWAWKQRQSKPLPQ